MARSKAGAAAVFAAVLALLVMAGCTEAGDTASDGSGQSVQSAEPGGESIRDGNFAITVDVEGVRYGVATEGQFVKTLEDGQVAAYIDAGKSYAGVPLRVENLSSEPNDYAFSVTANDTDGGIHHPRLIVGAHNVFGQWIIGDFGAPHERTHGVPPGDSVTVEVIFKIPDGVELASITIGGTQDGFTAEVPL